MSTPRPALCSGPPRARRAAEALAEALRALSPAEPGEIEAADGLVWVLFPESDFAVRVEHGASGPAARVSIRAAVRGPEPSLDTWWSEWMLRCPRADLAAAVHADVVGTRNRYLRMLAERYVDARA